MQDQDRDELPPSPDLQRSGSERCGHDRGGRPCMRERGHDSQHEWHDGACSITWK